MGIKRSEEETIKILKGLCEEEGSKFIGFEGEYNGVSSKFNWLCHKGHECTIIIRSFLKGSRCMACFRERMRKKYSIEWIGETRTIDGNIQEICKVEDKHVFYVCRSCNKDFELFPTLFRIHKSDWRTTKSCCACGKMTRWTKDQFKVLCIRKSEELGNKFLGFVGTFKDSRSKIKQLCPTHGEWSTGSVDHLLYSGKSCPKCTNSGYDPLKPGTLYVVEWSGVDGHIVKVGITNKPVKYRIADQKSETSLKPVVIETFNAEDGYLVEGIERNLKKRFSKEFGVDKKLFPDGYTEAFYCNTTVLADVISFCNEKFSRG